MPDKAKKAQQPLMPQAQPTAEKQTNCLGCGKPLKKIKRYYRNGKYYCTKKCWRNKAYSSLPKEEKGDLK